MVRALIACPARNPGEETYINADKELNVYLSDKHTIYRAWLVLMTVYCNLTAMALNREAPNLAPK